MKHWSVVLLLSVVACFGVAALAEATATDSAAVAQTDAAVQSVSESEVEAAAAAEVEAAAEAEAESDSEAEAEIESEAGAESEAEGEASTESQADLDAAHENAVATLEQYAEKAHELRDEIIGAEHSLMEQMSAIDSCPPSELSALMARAKKQITHLFQIKALYLAIKQQQKQLQALVDAGTGKRVPRVAPRRPAPKAKPFAKPAKAAAPAAPTNVVGLAAMNAKLVNALARLESVTKRLARVERRTTKHRKATMVIASQMEKDEKRLNKHSRVLRRVRSGQKKIRASLKRLAASCKRGAAAEKRLSRKGKGKAKARKAIRKARAAGKKRAGKKSGRRQRRAAARKGKKAAKGKKAFDVRACWARCAKARTLRQQHCVRVCSRKAKWAAQAAAKKGKRSKRSKRSRKIHKKSHARGRKARRSPALKKCLAKCRKTNPVAKRAAAKKCAVSCFRRHMHRSVRSRKGKKGSRRGRGRVAKRAFNLKACLSRCPRSKKNAKRRSRRCTQRCYAAARAARRGRKGVAKKSNAALKKCFKTCRKGKKWDRKCVRACRARHGAKKAKRAAWSPKALKACFKTCRGRPRIVKRRNRYGKLRPIRVAGKWNKACVSSCRKRFGKPKSLKRKQRRAVRARKNRRINAALQKCYATCKVPAKKGARKGRGKARRVRWNQACVKRCRKLHGRKKAKLPLTAAYKACLKRCRPGKSFAKCKAACAKHNRRLRVPKVKSPSSKLVSAAIKGMKKKGKKAKKVRPETWEDVVRQSRRLLKKTVRLRDLVHKQVARHFDTNDVEGRKYNGWWSIYDILKGVKPGKHYTGRAKEIAADVRQIMAPVEAAAGTGKYGEVINSLKAADESFSSKFTREIGSPAFSLGSDPKFAGYVEKPLPGARIKHVPYNPLKPYESSQHTWHKTPPLSRLPELRDEEYDANLSPIYARQFKITPRKAPRAEQPFDLRTKNWDYPQIPYSYPVTMVKHDPRFKNPHVRAPTPGFHTEWPEFRFQQTASSADAAAAAPAAAPAPAAAEPMKEGTN